MADRVFFNRTASKRISDAVRHVENSRKRGRAGWYDYGNAGGSGGLKIGKTTSAWTKGTSQQIALYDKETRQDTGETVEVFNLFSDVETDKWVAFQSGYLTAAEC